jgi:hypothetical protein
VSKSHRCDICGDTFTHAMGDSGLPKDWALLLVGDSGVTDPDEMRAQEMCWDCGLAVDHVLRDLRRERRLAAQASPRDRARWAAWDPLYDADRNLVSWAMKNGSTIEFAGSYEGERAKGSALSEAAWSLPVVDTSDPFELRAEEQLEPPDTLATIGDLARVQHELAQLYGSCTVASGQIAGGDCYARISTPTAHGASTSSSLVGALAGALAALRSRLSPGAT